MVSNSAAPEETNWERTCNIPESMAIFWPLISGECDISQTPNALECAKRGDEGAIIAFSIDGNKFRYVIVDDRVT